MQSKKLSGIKIEVEYFQNKTESDTAYTPQAILIWGK